jgi:hypothetical protein
MTAPGSAALVSALAPSDPGVMALGRNIMVVTETFLTKEMNKSSTVYKTGKIKQLTPSVSRLHLC